MKWLACFAVAAGVACGDTADQGASDLGAQSGTDTQASPDTTQSNDLDVPADAASPDNQEIVLLSVTLVTHGTMSVAWKNPDSGCDVVQINRKSGDGAYAVVQTLTGQATSAKDEPGHSNGTYCYTVTCKLAELVSEPSNEICVTQ
jgi:hypothetical protein